jgi:hypothetical protein
MQAAHEGSHAGSERWWAARSGPAWGCVWALTSWRSVQEPCRWGCWRRGGELLDMCAGARPAHVHTSSTFPLGTLGPRIGHFRARYQAMWQCNTCSMQLQYAAMCRAGSWTKLCVTA